MAKIVIIAPAGAEDVDDAVKLLKAAGHEVETEEPTPKSLLHIVLGLLGPNAYGFGPGYAYSPGPQADDDLEGDPEADLGLDAPDDADADPLAADEPSEDDIEFDASTDDFNFEGVTVDGEPIKAVKSDAEHTTLVVEKLILGPKTTYMLNESSFSFWPADQNQPVQRVDVGASRGTTSLEVVVEQGETQELRIGKDLYNLFEVSKELSDQLDSKADGADEVTLNGKTYRRSGPKNSVSQPGKWREVKEKSAK